MRITKTMLAKDILEWLKPHSKVKINPQIRGTYIAGPVGEKEEDLQKILKAGKPCTVCALGGFVAAVAYRKDAVKLGYVSHYNFPNSLALGSDHDAHRILEGVFSISECNVIEAAFEHGEGMPPRIKTAKGRLKYICESIIANRGRFVPLPPA